MINILDDFTLINHKLSDELPYLNIYPLGDLHIGSGNFREDSFKRWVDMVQDDPYSGVILVGDMMDNGLKSSLTNAYNATLQPFEQKRKLAELLEPIKDKILAGVQGNHELRSTIVADLYPLYDVMAKLDLEHLYRQNMAFVKINLGRRNADRQCSYVLTLAHGASKTKTEKFSYAVDGMDALITGHIHTPESKIQSKIVIDPRNETVTMRDFIHLTVPSFQGFGGYALRKMYMPTSTYTIPIIRLDGKEKQLSVTWI